jgi:hypothetical protein
MPDPLSTSISPPSTSIIALVPLPCLAPYTLALALLSLPTGVELTHLDLASSTSESSASWSALRGEATPLDGFLLSRAELVVGEAVKRGCMGLAAVISPERGATLLLAPQIERMSLQAEGPMLADNTRK